MICTAVLRSSGLNCVENKSWTLFSVHETFSVEIINYML